MTCENGATAEWNIENWGLVNINSNDAKKIKCNIDFTKETLIKYLKNLESRELVEDDFGNLRYIGANPNNYVSFNGELWRIIGVMKDIENPDGTKEDKVKLIRIESIGKYAWDNKSAGTGSSTSKYGSNDWSDSALQKVLNEGSYWNRIIGSCPSGQNGATETCDFSESGLTNDAKNMISESVWNLGGSNSYNKTAKDFYKLERESTVYSGRPTKWTGKVGLMYPSDYGYATSGGSTTDRSACLTTSLYSWSGSNTNDCKMNDWLYSNNSNQWTLTPYSSSSVSIFIVYSTGMLSYSGAHDASVSSPSVYLTPDIGIESRGVGTSISPFVLKVN